MNKIKDKKIKIFILVAVLFTFISLFGTSYALYVGEDKGNENAYTTGLLDLSISEDSILSLNNPIPISDEEALTQTPYTITIKNTGTLSHTFDIKLLDTTTGNKLSLNYIKIKVDNQEATTLDNLTNNIIKSNITLDPGKSITIKIIMWLDINTPNSEMGKTYTAKVTTSGYGNYTEPPTASETIMALSSGDSWTSGASGVYATNSYTDTDGSTKYHEYRYIGSNVDNFVSFNNDMYRIIGVFDSNSHGKEGEYLVKLISANPLGGYSWGIYNTSNISGEYSDSANDWTGTTTGVKANLNVLLNEYFVNKSVTSSTYGDCGNWTYFRDYDTDYRTNDCTRIVGYGIDSSLRDYIETTTWYLYGGSDQSKQNWYSCERGGNSCTSANEGAYSSTTDAKIGLMYVSDYLYASGYYSSSDTTAGNADYYGNQNWLYSGYEWTITPSASTSTSVRDVRDGGASSDGATSPFVVRPSFYLKSIIYITGGSGTFDDPYTIGCNYCTS